ncbi:MAG: hypothetical protein M1825_003064 [Sarcosagium campestre]|nr:MAG: hypothetical protein M1825_003064 [Sarcosagium campestre]
MPFNLDTLIISQFIYSAYSAHEATSLASSPSAAAAAAAAAGSASSSTTDASSTASAALPTDIVLETLVASILVTLGLVFSSARLKPIAWAEWAGSIERGEEEGWKNPWIGLEWRLGFLDIRAKRREFAEWVREQGEVDKVKA